MFAPSLPLRQIPLTKGTFSDAMADKPKREIAAHTVEAERYHFTEYNDMWT